MLSNKIGRHPVLTSIEDSEPHIPNDIFLDRKCSKQ